MKTILAAGIAALLLSVTNSAAATITINDTSPALFEVECPSGCSGVLSDGSLSATHSDGVEIGSANEANIASYLTSIGLAIEDVTKFDLGTGGLNGSGSEEDFSFDVVAGYFFTKYATFTAFFYTDTAQTVTFTKEGGGRGGLSNYGTVSQVPVPAAGFLLLAGLGGLAVFGRRKTA